MNESLVRASIAEVVGTFSLVFFGCGAILIDEFHRGVLGLLGIALVFGLVVLAVVYALGHVSGAHINPAITIALASVGKFPWSRVAFYIAAQLVGAIIAAFLLKNILAHGETLGMTLPSVDLTKAFIIEVLLTAFLMLVVMGTTTDQRAAPHFAAIAIASVIVVDVLVGGVITGASMNPARSLGPALVAMKLNHIWLYIVAPIVGALLGAFLYVSCVSMRK